MIVILCGAFRDGLFGFVVIDLRWYAFIESNPLYSESGRSSTDLLPPTADWVKRNEDGGWLASYLPFDTSRTVFRSNDSRTGRAGCGRYVVFQLKD